MGAIAVTNKMNKVVKEDGTIAATNKLKKVTKGDGAINCFDGDFGTHSQALHPKREDDGQAARGGGGGA